MAKGGASKDTDWMKYFCFIFGALLVLWPHPELRSRPE